MLNLSEIRRKVKRGLPQTITDFVLKMKYLNQEIDGYAAYVSAVQGGKGLEVGGPSTIFKTILPVYQAAGTLDGVNFSPSTVWEGGLKTGLNYRYLGNRVGYQFISDATDLRLIETDKYDFVLSSNCLEHVANPIRALLEWRRVLRIGGPLILVLPNKDSNFDHRRPVTSFDHLLDDHRRNVTEHDMTHLEEILALHDLTRDPPAGSIERFRQRSQDNFTNRTLHHYVFDLLMMRRLLDHVGFDVIRTSDTPTDFFALGVKRP